MNIISHVMGSNHSVSKRLDADLIAEFDFHVACRTDELMRAGMAPDAAKASAEKAFGNRQRILGECRRVHRKLLTPLGWLAVLASSLVISCLIYSLVGLQSRNAALVAELQNALQLAHAAKVPTTTPFLASPSAGISDLPKQDKQTLKGKITDPQGNPIPDAKVLLIHKSWPNGKYQQEDNCLTTGTDGTYAFEGLYQKDSQNAFMISVLASGFEMKSRYELYKAGRSAPAFDLQLKPAKSINFKFVDETGAPLSETDLFIASRKVGTKEHLIYEQSSPNAKMTTDENGQLAIAHFLPKDVVTFGIIVFNETQSVEYKVLDADEQTVKLEKKR